MSTVISVLNPSLVSYDNSKGIYSKGFFIKIIISLSHVSNPMHFQDEMFHFVFSLKRGA